MDSIILFLCNPFLSYVYIGLGKGVVEWMDDWLTAVFHWWGYIRATEQPGLMRWILLWITPQTKDRSLDLEMSEAKSTTNWAMAAPRSGMESFAFSDNFPPCWGSGPFLEVLQDQANPWRSRSKLLHLLLSSKISLISMAPSGDRIRY